MAKIMQLVNGRVRMQGQLYQTWKALLTLTLFSITKELRVDIADCFPSVLICFSCYNKIP